MKKNNIIIAILAIITAMVMLCSCSKSELSNDTLTKVVLTSDKYHYSDSAYYRTDILWTDWIGGRWLDSVKSVGVQYINNCDTKIYEVWHYTIGDTTPSILPYKF